MLPTRKKPSAEAVIPEPSSTKTKPSPPPTSSNDTNPTPIPLKSDVETASTRVFDTVELLEKILENYSPHTLLCSTSRINQTWKFVIDTNKLIQQRLFFIPWSETDFPDSSGEFNPFLPLLCYADDKQREQGCNYDFGPPVKGDPGGDSDDAEWDADNELQIFYEFNWKKIELDERFTRESAS